MCNCGKIEAPFHYFYHCLKQQPLDRQWILSVGGHVACCVGCLVPGGWRQHLHLHFTYLGIPWKKTSPQLPHHHVFIFPTCTTSKFLIWTWLKIIPGLIAKDLGLEFYVYMWSGHCPFLYSMLHICRVVLHLWGTSLGYLYSKVILSSLDNRCTLNIL